MPSFDVPTDDVVERALRLIPTLQLRRVFYGGLENPLWVEPLTRAGAFRIPPQPIEDEHHNVVETHWPEIDYLVRMAPIAPEPVVKAVLPLKSSKNSWIRRGIVAIGAAVPPSIAAELGPLLREWAPDQFGLRTDPRELISLVTRLLLGGERKLGVSLANSLFRPGPPVPTRGLAGEPRVTIDAYWYEQGIPAVTKALGDSALQVVLPWLEAYERLNGSVGDGRDLSYLHRPTLRVRPNSHREVEHSLIDAVRDVSLEAMKRDPNGTAAALLRSGQSLPKKIMLFALADALVTAGHGAEDTQELLDLAQQFIGDPEYAQPQYRIEFAEVVQAVVAIDPRAAGELPRVIAAGPFGSTVALTERLRQDGDSDQDAEKRAIEFMDYWQQRWLATIGVGSLPAELRARLQQLDEERGAIESPLEPDFKITIWSGPSSDVSQEELGRLGPSDLLAHFAEWHPVTETFAGPTHEGRGRELTAIVQANPLALTGQHWLAGVLRPTYVRAIFRGWEEALKDGTELPWYEVADLVEAVLEGPNESAFSPEGERFDDDPDWRASKQSAASLLAQLVHKRPADSATPPDVVARLAPLIVGAVRDEGAIADYLAREGGMDPLTLSINARWPVAVRALVSLAAWRGSGGTADDALSEFDRALELDDNKAAIAAIAGEYLSRLFLTDEQWLRERSSRLYGDQASFDEPQQVALSTALATNQPHTALLEVLRPALMRTVAVGDAVRLGWNMHRTMSQLLGDWIMEVLVRGQLSLDDPLLVAYFTSETPEVRGDAVGHTAWRFMHSDRVDDSIRDRLAGFWDSRVAHVKDDPDDAAELRDFYWFVRSGKFEPSWWAPRLVEAAALDSDFNGHGMIGEQIADAAWDFPGEMLQVARTIVAHQSPAHLGDYDIMEHAVPQTIAAAATSGDAYLEAEAARFMDQLGEGGYIRIEDRVKAAIAERRADSG